MWSERLGTVINAGCVPLIISDNYALPFWDHLDWSSISLRMSMHDAVVPGALRSFLLNISEEHAVKLETNLAHVRNSLTYNLPTQTGDIFDRIIESLTDRMTAIHPSSGI